MTPYLLAYDPVTILLSSNTYTDSILHKTPPARIAAKKNKISFTGSATVQLCYPWGNECLDAIKVH